MLLVFKEAENMSKTRDVRAFQSVGSGVRAVAEILRDLGDGWEIRFACGTIDFAPRADWTMLAATPSECRTFKSRQITVRS